MNKKSSGRPRIYDSASIKLDAFRKRQESAGYLRKEVLVTKDTWTRVMALAAELGVGTVDAASGLLEHGLNSFASAGATARSQMTSTVNHHRLVATAMQGLGNAPEAKGLSAAARAPVGEGNPITQFFARRKETPNGNSPTPTPTPNSIKPADKK